MDPWLDYEYPTEVPMPGCATTRLRYRGQTQKWCARARRQPRRAANCKLPSGIAHSQQAWALMLPAAALIGMETKSLPCCERAASHMRRSVQAPLAACACMPPSCLGRRQAGAARGRPARGCRPWRPAATRPPLPRRCLMYFYGSEAEIDLDRHGEREFSEYAWLPLEDLPAKARLSGRPACAKPRVLPATLRPASPPFRIMHVPRSIAGAA